MHINNLQLGDMTSPSVMHISGKHTESQTHTQN